MTRKRVDNRARACPSCGKPCQTKTDAAVCRNCQRGTGALPAGSVEWMLEEAARQRADQPFTAYAEARAERRPWISITEAAFELDVGEGRISQLIADGTFLWQKDPDRPRAKQVLAAEVYEYKPKATRKRAAA